MLSIFVICAASMIILSSCAAVNVVDKIKEKIEETAADKEMLTIVRSINKGDSFPIDFSKEAYIENKDLGNDINALVYDFDSKIESYECRKTTTIRERKKNRNETEKYISWYTVETAQNEYVFLLVGYSRDEKHVQNRNLYMLRIFEMPENGEFEYEYSDEMEEAGIIWDNNSDNGGERK